MKAYIVFALCAALGVSVFAGVAAAGGHSGFPLDDAWIHQTYARNWALTGQLAYVPGTPSAGSTAPLWTLLLSVPYRLGWDYATWTLMLGAMFLAWSAWLMYRITDRLWPNRSRVAWAAGLCGVLEWHLIWAAASGMETMLFSALALAVMERVLARGSTWLIGVLGGLLMLTRPEGLLLMGLAAGVVAAERSGWGGWKALVQIGLALIITLMPGLWFNLQASGSLFPNTFYAKQAEYAELMSSVGRWLASVGEMILAPLAGVASVLLPGLAAWLVAQRRTARQVSAWARWLPLAWAAAHTLIYAVRLPVHYQHGRYLLPIIPVLVIYGVGGTAQWLAGGAGRGARVAGRVLAVAAGVVVIVFWPLGAAAYTADVAVIDGEMVAVARWLHIHTPEDAVIAAHDIGAIGYFAQRPLLDLAGLISPEVIPFIRDEGRLRDWLTAKGAAYLVTFPEWYPVLTRDLSPEFAGASRYSPTHLTVYRLP